MTSCAYAYADRYNADPRSPNAVAVDTAPPYALAEDDNPGADWAEAARIAAYLRLHHASDHRVVTLYPLAAYAAATGRAAAPNARGVYRYGRYASARRATATAAGGPVQLR